MWQLLASETEVVIHSGFVYVPLLYDPQIKAELEFLAGKQALPPPGVIETIATNLIYTDGGYFIKSLSLASLVENYPAVFPEEFERERLRLIRHILPDGFAYQPPLDAKLKTILFEILPHFIRPHRALGRQQVGAASVPAYLASKMPVNRGDTAHLERLRERETSLKQVLLRLEHLETPPGPAPEKHGHGRELITWFRRALQTTIVTQEVSHWQRELTQGTGPLEPSRGTVGRAPGHRSPRGPGGRRFRFQSGPKTSGRIPGLQKDRGVSVEGLFRPTLSVPGLPGRSGHGRTFPPHGFGDVANTRCCAASGPGKRSV